MTSGESGTPLQRLLQLGHPAKFIQGGTVVDFQQFAVFQSSHVFDGDVHAFHVAQNAATLLLQGRGELPYLGGGGMKELIELLAESRIVGSDGGQHSGMVKRRIQRLFELADLGDDLGVQQRVQVAAAQGFLCRGSKCRNSWTCSSENEGTSASAIISIRAISKAKRKRAVQPKAAALPFPGTRE